MSEGDRGCLVLGAAIGYRPDQVKPFLQSLRMSGYSGDVAIIVDQRDMEAFSNNSLCGDVNLIAGKQWVPFKYGWVRGRKKLLFHLLWWPVQASLWLMLRASGSLKNNGPLLSGVRNWITERLYPPTQTRYFYFLKLIAQSNYQRILISDVRDVIFQKNPFELLPEQGLAVGMEVSSYSLGQEPFNSGWILKGYGQEVLKRISGELVSCSGVTYGDRLSMIAYLEAMESQILALPLRATPVGGMDQGVHNYLLAEKYITPVSKMKPLKSPLATLNGVNGNELEFDPAGNLLNNDGTEIAILHQYDRVENSGELFGKLLQA